MRVFTYVPDTFAPDSPVLIVMHGVKRDADRYRDTWRDIAAKTNTLLLVPEFSNEMWPKSLGYNLGHMQTKGGQKIPRNAWSLTAIERAFDKAVTLSGSMRSGYKLYGHSAGAQFVHRFIMFTGVPRVERAVAANAGWYTLPHKNDTFPYGLDGIDVADETLREAFSVPLTILLGEDDNDPNSKYLRRTPEALAQGAHRLSRGASYLAAAQLTAAQMNTRLNWQLKTVPGVGHSNKGMAPAAAQILLEK
jgi:poly(3-hydroxybutyrate) depolymerase